MATNKGMGNYSMSVQNQNQTPVTAYATMGEIVSNQIGPNRYTSPNDLYLQFLGATDPLAKSTAFQNLYRGLASQAAPAGSKSGNMFDYVQTLLRGTKFSTGKTATGILDPKDISGMETALKGAIGQNADLVSYLEAIAKSGLAGGGIKQPDTTPKYNKQISTALKYKDANDAKVALSDAYFAAWGSAPSADLITQFQNAWNQEVKLQEKPTTTSTVTSFKPVIDTKTGKQLKNKEGVLQYETITKMGTTTGGEGFTAEEQQKFLADYLVTNFPQEKFNVEGLGGAAKTIYDEIAATYKNNLLPVPAFSTVAPLITSLIGQTDATVSKTILDKAKSDIRVTTANKYMSIADYLNAGEDATKYIQPLQQTVSAALETDVTVEDGLMKQFLNFQGSDGKYRLPNDWEITQAIMKDPRYKKTSKAINQAINVADSLASKLGR
jgi:hypothetical protein